jgi:5-methylcytosine-specific restriction protein A
MTKIYDKRAWRRLSAYKLRQQPLCEPCLRAGRTIPAQLVDHIHAIDQGGALIPTLDGLMSMCVSCHNQKHARGIKGADVNGMPLNPAHPWFR